MNPNPDWRALAHDRLSTFRHGKLDDQQVCPKLGTIYRARRIIDGLQQGPDCITLDDGAIVIETIVNGCGPRIVVRHDVDGHGVHMCLLVDSKVVWSQEPPR